MIVHADTPVTLIGGGPVGRTDIATARAFGPIIVAADGGADTCLAADVTPVAVIGDMDSISDAAREAFADRLHRVDEQETTDFDKALRGISAPVTICVGFSGGRFDHELAALNTLLRRPDLPCVILGAENVSFLCPSAITLDLPGGMPLSLFPLGPAPVRSTGLVWPTDGLDFRPDGRIGTSNEVAGGAPVRLIADAPRMLVILPRAALGGAVTALAQAGRWPKP